jgi:hypothetical protein
MSLPLPIRVVVVPAGYFVGSQTKSPCLSM